MPVDFVHADLHGRKQKAIPEMSARPQRRGGPFEVGAAGVRAIQEQTVVRGPDLAVAGHGLAVKPHVPRRRAEEHMRQPVLRAADGEFALAPVDTGPAVRPPVGVAHGAVPVVGQRLARVRFVHPARLGNADAAQFLGALEERQERYLKCPGKLALERKQRRRAPEQEAAREGQQVQPAFQVGSPDRGGQPAEGPEGQQVACTADGIALLDNERLRPGGQALRPPVLNRPILLAGKDAEATPKQVTGRLAKGRLQQVFYKFETRPGRQFGFRVREKTLPEGLLRPLFAAAEKGPADPPLVVLGPRERQRQNRHQPLMRKAAGAFGQLRRPAGVSLQLACGDAVGVVACCLVWS